MFDLIELFVKLLILPFKLLWELIELLDHANRRSQRRRPTRRPHYQPPYQQPRRMTRTEKIVVIVLVVAVLLAFIVLPVWLKSALPNGVQ